jgi:hypothetical protein
MILGKDSIYTIRFAVAHKKKAGLSELLQIFCFIDG